MYVGVILHVDSLPEPMISIPHVCGGDPLIGSPVHSDLLYSPCMWG